MCATPEMPPPPARFPADERLVRDLLAAQFPRWAGLPVRRVAREGWDNRTFRLGAELLVRLPSAAPYALAVAKEQRWLPVLAAALPLPVPEPVALGTPAAGYPHPWSVYRWLPGEPVDPLTVTDLPRLARDLAAFLAVLQAVDPTDGPAPGQHNWFRGGPLTTYDAQVRGALAALDGRLPDRLLREIWAAALGARWDGRPVWFHGDVAPDNLLVHDGVLAAVIDFGTCGVGDPACDLAIAWTLFPAASRQVFRRRLGVTADTWARGRGWALWKALVGHASARERGDDRQVEETGAVLRAITEEYATAG
ncbi:aminoglycoside phosphotransferase family protein [Streptomyces sp. DSM 44915]|uniref:Aminoglycoside phosphotransferase family protein n=1 Tax=Streptomyces chisholmiae TaxID=3075540 RepID=A0ABU2JLK3_9ACTN|nr:aminoglycoside phosphotransferase family protein [Streptomyces sp. DSM 44915]MDT0265133.1 aminoglycoside phosphotransferase family protein [Streptomyces sp. DSM 44915]